MGAPRGRERAPLWAAELPHETKKKMTLGLPRFVGLTRWVKLVSKWMKNAAAHSDYLGLGHSMHKVTYMGFVKVETPQASYFVISSCVYTRRKIQSKKYDF